MFSREKRTDRKEEKIEQIILEKYNSYYRMAYSYVHNESDASDIVQEGAYKAIKYSSSLKNVEYASTWIYRIMMNEIYRVLEGKKCVSIDDESVIEPEHIDKYENIDLKRALDAMPPKDKAVIQLKYLEDMKLDEIAIILDENPSTIKSRLYRGIKKLKLEMTDEVWRGVDRNAE